MRARSWSVRSKLIALLLLPLISLATLWAYAAYLSLGNALTLEHTNTLGNRLARPVINVFSTIGHERRDAVVLATAHSSRPAALADDRRRTDAAIAAFRAQSRDGTVRGDESVRVRSAVDAADRAISGIDEVRKRVDAGSLSSSQVLASYTQIETAIEQALHAMVILPDENAEAYGEALYNFAPAGDFLSQEDALISAAAASPAHRLATADYSAVAQDIGSQRYLTGQAIENLPRAQRTQFEKLAVPDGPVGRLSALEQQVVAAGPDAKSLPFTAATWRAVYDAEDEAVSTASIDDISALFIRTGPPAHRAFVELILSGALGLMALVASVVISTKIARSLVNDIVKLGRSARNLTDDRLRDVVGRLRRGESVDVRSDMAKPRFVNHEMAQLGEAFQALQLTAVELAEEDIRLHRGINDVFLNLARRSQALVHRQLALIDAMEAREEDPKALADLFLLDQLATRMRRYAEGLIIVSGAPPGRFWRHPVPIVDVIRGAVSETEQYTRVLVLPVPTVGVLGRAAADIIHLLAELIENAEAFSPDDSQVRVSISRASGGLVIEIDDRGLGMQEEEMAEANARITADFDVSSLDSTQLGLVTVGRLAQRHGVQVSLRSSPYGGVSAIVLVPHALLEWDAAALPAPGATAAPDRPRPWDGAAARGVLSDGGNAPTPVHQSVRHPHPILAHAQVTEWASSPSDPSSTKSERSLERGYGHETARSTTHGSYPHTSAALPARRQGVFPSVTAHEGQDTVDGLPRRVPQASLARELREEAETVRRQPVMNWGGGAAVPPGAGAPGRAPGGTGGPPGADWLAQLPREQAPYAGPSQGGYASAAHRPRAWDQETGPVSLFGATQAAADTGDGEPADHEDRPQHVRSLMAALQAGTARARADHHSEGS